MTRDECPVCPICKGKMRRRDGVLVCDIHGAVDPVWVRLARGSELVEISRRP